MTRIAKGIPRGVSIVALATVAMLLVAACGTGVSVLQPPPAVTEQGKATEWLYQVVFIVAVVIFFFVEALIVYAAIRYRRRKGDDALPPQIHGNNVLEVIWTAVPVAIVAVLFVISWQTLNTVDAVSADPKLRIEVTGFQWQWQFTYPDQGVTIIGLPDHQPELVVPVNETVQVKLESRDVNHGFYVPAFLFKRDVIPGKTNVFDFKATEIGTFSGQCTQFCGLMHSSMRFSVKVVSQEEFDAWVARAKATPTPALSATPAPSASAGAGGGGGAVQPAQLQLTAQNIAFDTGELSAPPNTPIQLTFVNDDNGIPHDVAIRKDSPTGDQVFSGEVFPGIATKVYDVPALPAGGYAFVCTVHPNMTGTLTVQ